MTATTTSSPVDLLREACATGDLHSVASLSDDGKSLTLLGSSPIDATIPHAIMLGGGEVVNYTLASLYLQLVHPALLRYHKACGAAGVKDPVKTLDRDRVLSHFLGGGGGGVVDGGTAVAAAVGEEGEEDLDLDDDAMDVASDDDEDAIVDATAGGVVPRSSRGSRDEGGRSSSSSSRDKRRRRDDDDGPSSSSRREKKSRKSKDGDDDEGGRRGGKGGGGGKASSRATVAAPIANEVLVANLGKIADKRRAPVVVAPPASSSGEGKDGGNDAAAVVVADDADATRAESAPSGAANYDDDDGGPEGGTTDDVVGEKEEEEEDRNLLLAWLSPEGYRVDSPTVAHAIENDREAVRRMTAMEIPVGDSASVLRAGAGGEVAGGVVETTAVSSPAGGGGGGVRRRDFARVLEIYQEVAAAEERAKRAAAAASSSSSKRRPPPPPVPSSSSRGKAQSSSSSSPAAAASSSRTPVAGNPIIVVPNAMTSVITMINAGIFLGKEGTYLSREQAMNNPGAGKRGGSVTMTRKLAPRLGGAEITYEIIDNPSTRLKKDEWDRVVAVICQGASWQFKGWRYSDPVDLFSRTFGFYVGLEGAAVPSELQGWNVKIGKVSRDRRGLDNVCLASFWNGLEEFMAVHKQDFIKS